MPIFVVGVVVEYSPECVIVQINKSELHDCLIDANSTIEKQT